MKKGATSLLMVVAIVVVGTVLLVPGLADSIYAMATGAIYSCYIAPYDANCVCGETEVKKQVAPEITQLIPKFYCEQEELSLDPDSPTFEADTIAFAEDYCNEPCVNGTPEVEVVQGVTGNREACIYCWLPDMSGAYWFLRVDIEDGSVLEASC